MESLQGKAAIVTGGTRGIGRAIAERLLRDGVDVAICGRSADSTARAVEEMTPWGRVFGHPADISRLDQVQAFFKAVDREFGRLDILINNAAEGVFRKVAEMTPAEWHRVIDLDLNGPFYCAHEALARFRDRGGHIVNISSLAGKNAFTGGAAYNAAKAGLNIFGEALMLDHRYDRVRVTSILPGSVATGFSGTSSGDDSWKIAPEDIAETVALVLRIPERSTISQVEIRPSRPRK